MGAEIWNGFEYTQNDGLGYNHIQCSQYFVYCQEQRSKDRNGTYTGNEERSREHCCRGKAVCIVKSEFVFVVLVIPGKWRK
jgi:hypothetical protein